MNTSLTATATIIIQAPAAKVWEALTEPALIKQYMFGSDVVSEWKEGSSIVWKGEWEGKVYEDRGVITQFIPEHVLEYTYNHAASTQENIVLNELAPVDGQPDQTRLTITQTGSADETSREHSEKNWNMVLDSIKKMLEQTSS